MTQQDQKNIHGIFEVKDQAEQFLLNVMNHYRGSPEQKVERTTEFLDELLFFTQHDLAGNIFAPIESRNIYNMAYYSRHILIPKIITELNDDNTIQVIDCVFLSEHSTQFNNKRGIIPMVVGELLSARSATKKLLKEEKDENKKKVLDGFQLAYKLTANSVYGQLGAKTSCILFKKVAACTTAVGRQKIIDAREFAFDWVLIIIVSKS